MKWIALTVFAGYAAFAADPATPPAEEKPLGPEEIAGLVKQLSAPRVRLRDEADEQLRRAPEALQAVEAMMKAQPETEAGKRAAAIWEALRTSLWMPDVNRLNLPPSAEELSGLKTVVSVAAFKTAPQGDHFLTASRGGLIVWDSATLTPTRTTVGTGRYVGSAAAAAAAISPDGKLIASVSDSGDIFIDDADLKRVRTFEAEPIPTPAVAVATPPAAPAALDPADLSPPMPTPAPTLDGGRISLSDNVSKSAEPSLSLEEPSPTRSGTVTTVRSSVRTVTSSTVSAAQVAALARARAILAVQFSPDGRALFAMNAEKGLIRCDLETGERRTLGPAGLQAAGMALSADGKAALLVTLGASVAATLVDTATGQVICSGGLEGTLSCVATARGGGFHVGTRRGTVFRVEQGNRFSSREVYRVKNGAVTGVDSSPDGKWMAVSSRDPMQSLVVLNAANGETFWTPAPSGRVFTGAAFFDSDTLVTPTETGQIQRWKRNSRGIAP